MERPVWFDAARVAGEIFLKLAPSRVLVCGAGATRLSAELRKHGMEASADVPSGTDSGPDLIVCLGMEAFERAQTEAHGRILVAAADIDLVVRRAAALGFSPDVTVGLRGFGVPAVLVTRCGQPLKPQDLAVAAQLAVIRHSVDERDREIERLRADLSAVGEALSRMDEFAKAHAAYLARTTDGLRDIAESRIWRLLRGAAGIVSAPARLFRWKHDEPAAPVDPYSHWIETYEHFPAAAPEALNLRPLISILLPVCNPAAQELNQAIASVRAQTYSNWELSIALDGSAEAAVEAMVQRSAASDKRIRVTRLESHGGIAAATNAALMASTGEYAGFLDQDDELAPGALYSVVEAMNAHPEADLLYSDEDKIDARGRRREPFFKPDWSPDLLLSENYICHFTVARRRLIVECGGLRSEYDGSQDHDLLLRLTERTQKIVHIPRVLYHWRMSDGSAAQSTTAKPYAVDAARRAVEDHLERNGIHGRVEIGCGGIRLRVRYAIPAGVRVSVVIPSGGNRDCLSRCLDSIFEKTAYRNYEIVIVDNSAGDSIERLVKSDAHNRPVRYVDWRSRPFNYSVINNAAARLCESPLLLFLNDDTEALSAEWLESMVELAARPEVGAVGARLLYPDGTIQHAGVVLGLYGVCEHAFRHLDSRERHYFDFPDVIRNVSAVTGACMMVRADVFWGAGGFDEARFPTSFNDIDLCLRIGRLGYRILYTPHAIVRHYESVTRRDAGLLDDYTATEIMRAAWKNLIAADPFYSPHLTRSSGDYSIRA